MQRWTTKTRRIKPKLKRFPQKLSRTQELLNLNKTNLNPNRISLQLIQWNNNKTCLAKQLKPALILLLHPMPPLGARIQNKLIPQVCLDQKSLQLRIIKTTPMSQQINQFNNNSHHNNNNSNNLNNNNHLQVNQPINSKKLQSNKEEASPQQDNPEWIKPKPQMPYLGLLKKK